MSANKLLTLPICLVLSHFNLKANLLESSQLDSLPSTKSSLDSKQNSNDIDSSLEANSVDSSNIDSTQDNATSLASQNAQTSSELSRSFANQILKRTQLYGHIGTFGKSSILGNQKDSYLTLHFSANLSYDFFKKGEHLLNATIGI